MTENEFIGSVIAIIATLFGLITGIQALSRSKTTKDLEHRIVLSKLEEIMKHNQGILNHLEEVLNHPDDTHFSVHDLHVEVMRDLQDIKRLLELIRTK